MNKPFKLKYRSRLAQRVLLPLMMVAVVIATSCGSAKKAPDASQGKGEKIPHVPSVMGAQVKTLWIPDRIEGDKWEEGHYLYVIEKSATWKVE